MDADELFAALQTATRGDSSALDRLFPALYQELKRQAAGYLRGERAGHTLQPTALAHETYLRLMGRRDFPWQNRAHFMATAARAMRGILVDHARRRRAQKRGGGREQVPLDATMAIEEQRPVAFDDLDRALEDLARRSERQAKVVELRYFGGLSAEETAEVLGVSPVTVKRDWATARAWLYRALSESGPGGA